MSPIRYRVWDGERMHHPDDPDVCTTGSYRIYPDGDLNDWLGKPGQAAEPVALLSTGLRDADGREVFDGDVVDDGEERWAIRFGPHCIHDGDYYGEQFTGHGFYGVTAFGKERGIWGLDIRTRARVVGHVYEPAYAHLREAETPAPPADGVWIEGRFQKRFRLTREMAEDASGFAVTLRRHMLNELGEDTEEAP